MELLTFKGSSDAIELVYKEGTSAEECILLLEKAVSENGNFFKNGALKVSYNGTELDYFGEVLLSEAVKKNFGKKASLVKKHRLTKKELSYSLDEDEVICRISDKSLRSGEIFFSRGDVLIKGDVNPGAIVSALGNITVLGTLRGTAIVRQKGFVYAHSMQPSQIRIGKFFSYNKKGENVGTAIASVQKGEIILNCL